jgi:hypothetical protein
MPIIDDKQVYVVAGNHIVQNRQTIPLPGLIQPLKVPAAILGEFEKKLAPMATVGDMPDVAGNVMAVGSCHRLLPK